jgi:hypothetical protein
MLLLPGDPLFYETLAHPPRVPLTHGTNFVCRVGSYVLYQTSQLMIQIKMEFLDHINMLNVLLIWANWQLPL